MADTIEYQTHAGRCRRARAGVRRSVLAAAGGRAAGEGGSTCDNGLRGAAGGCQSIDDALRRRCDSPDTFTV